MHARAMPIFAALLAALVAVEHLWFLILEMFLYRKPTGLETFHITQQAADTCAVLAMNQGLYNGFLAAGILLSIATRSVLLRRYALGCVLVAGIYGAWSLGSPALLALQSGPALVALLVGEWAQARVKSS